MEGLLVKGHPQEPEEDQGQEPGRPPGPPEDGQGGPESDAPASSHDSGRFRPQAAAASPAIRARTTGTRGRAKGRARIRQFAVWVGV